MKRVKRILLLLGVTLVLASCSSGTKKKCGGSDGVCAIGDEKKLVVVVPPTLLD